MKNIWIIALAGIFLLPACSASKKTSTSTKTTEKIENVSAIIQSLSAALGNTLNLNNKQKQSLSGALNTFIHGINNQDSGDNLNDLRNSIFSNLKNLFTPEQYSKWMGLTGKKLNTKSVAASLTGGDKLTNDALNVLVQLLSK